MLARFVKRERERMSHEVVLSNVWSRSLVLLVLFVFCVWNVTPIHADDTSFYTEVGAGMYWLDWPIGSPLVRLDHNERIAAFLDPLEEGRQGSPLVTLTLGAKTRAWQTPITIELSGFLTDTRVDHTKIFPGPRAEWDALLARFDAACPIELLDGSCPLNPRTEDVFGDLAGNDETLQYLGWVAPVDGSSLEPTRGGDVAFAWGDPVGASTQWSVQYFGNDLLVGVPIDGLGQTELTLFAGPSYKHRRQDLNLVAWEANRPIQVNNLIVRNELEAWYIGGMLGGRIAVPVWETWRATLDTRVGLYQLRSRAFAYQRTYLSSGSVLLEDVTHGLWTHEVKRERFAASVTTRASLTVPIWSRLSLQLNGGLDYLSRAPYTRYARIGDASTLTEPMCLNYDATLATFTTAALVVTF